MWGAASGNNKQRLKTVHTNGYYRRHSLTMTRKRYSRQPKAKPRVLEDKKKKNVSITKGTVHSKMTAVCAPQQQRPNVGALNRPATLPTWLAHVLHPSTRSCVTPKYVGRQTKTIYWRATISTTLSNPFAWPHQGGSRTQRAGPLLLVRGEHSSALDHYQWLGGGRPPGAAARQLGRGLDRRGGVQ